ncbi:hypothetical protein [Mammaliicoccus vitulinus]|uniref:hypothetical protein n=1 Tax=Mammaliicoccus vitulinus TaxID=71237 RepID=UPI000D1EAD77|nr:hypothetical protein [Mammaliicoccus vitulinus]PTI71960.1 hypothetical protein BU073_04885 [Mammaliicoccus vitulinus]
MYEHHEIFQMINDYSWMRETIKQDVLLSKQVQGNSFLSLLTLDKENEIKMMKQKVSYIDKHIELIDDLKDYWMIILKLENKTNKYIFKTMKISGETLYKRISNVIDMFIEQDKKLV